MKTARARSSASPTGIRWRLVIGVLILNAIVVAGTVWALQQSRERYQREAEKDALNTSKLLEQSLADMIEKVEMNIHAVKQEYLHQKEDGHLSEASLNAFMTQYQARFPEMGGLRIADRNGKIIYGSGEAPFRGRDIADREYFKFLRDHPGAGTAISPPVFGVAVHDWIVVVARRISRPDGSFDGVIYGTLEVARMDWLLSLADIGKQGVMALLHEDLTIISRQPDGSRLQRPAWVNPAPGFKRFIEEKKQYGVFVEASPVDGIERIVSARRVGSYPLYLIVGRAPAEYLEKWKREVVNACLLLGVFIVVTISMAGLLQYSWRMQSALTTQMARNQSMFHALASMSSDWFWEQDKEFRFVRTPDDLEHKYGITYDALEGKTRWEIGIGRTEDEWRAHRLLLEQHQPFHDFEYCFIDARGETRYVSVSGEPVIDERGEFAGYRGVGRDLTEMKRYEARLQHMAQYDSLTGLPNRALFHDRVNQLVSMFKRQQQGFALLYVDLDRFKPVNDRYGHGVGDHVLKVVASRIREVIRESDTAARIGGDEFALLLPPIATADDARKVADKIVETVTMPIVLEGIEEDVRVGVSIGVALFPQDASDGDSLIRMADAAMYQSKQAGGNGCTFASAA